jgi:hypothetical protein
MSPIILAALALVFPQKALPLPMCWMPPSLRGNIVQGTVDGYATWDDSGQAAIWLTQRICYGDNRAVSAARLTNAEIWSLKVTLHENAHVYYADADEARTECRAIRLLPDLTTALGFSIAEGRRAQEIVKLEDRGRAPIRQTASTDYYMKLPAEYQSACMGYPGPLQANPYERP